MNCQKCFRPIRGTTRGINCSNCNSLYHLTCGKVSETLSKEIEEGTSDWRCHLCRDSNKRKSIISNGFLEQSSSSSSVNSNKNTANVNVPTPIITKSVDVNSTISNLAASIKLLQEQQQMFITSLDTIGQQLCDLQSLNTTVTSHDNRIRLLETENKDMKLTIKTLAQRLDNLDQKFNNNLLKISSIPYINNENLYDAIINIGNKLGITLSNTDIIDVYRQKAPNIKERGNEHLSNDPTIQNLNLNADGNSADDGVTADINGKPDYPVIVKFKSHIMKAKFITSFRQLKRKVFFDNNNKYQLYINEYLSSIRHNLFHKARLFKNANNYKYLWTKNGNIFIRKENGSKVIRVTMHTDFTRIEDANGALEAVAV